VQASDTCRRQLASAAGFTLIEILLVVLFLGLMTGIAGPRFVTFYERVLFAYRESDVLRQITDLGVASLSRGKELRLATQPPLPPEPGQRPKPAPARPAEEIKLDLPDGWRIIADPPIEYRFDGFCNGGRLAIVSSERRSEWRLDAPHCRPQPVAGS
jgi:general secretion pathway protein G